jgi:hypothetical protein
MLPRHLRRRVTVTVVTTRTGTRVPRRPRTHTVRVWLDRRVTAVTVVPVSGPAGPGPRPLLS